jgi:hypothetical protein
MLTALVNAFKMQAPDEHGAVFGNLVALVSEETLLLRDLETIEGAQSAELNQRKMSTAWRLHCLRKRMLVLLELLQTEFSDSNSSVNTRKRQFRTTVQLVERNLERMM